MNLNQSQTEQYRRRCHKSLRGVVSFIDKLFDKELYKTQPGHRIFSQRSISQWWFHSQKGGHIEEYIVKYCEPEYYALLTERIRKLKLERRKLLDKHS